MIRLTVTAMLIFTAALFTGCTASATSDTATPAAAAVVEHEHSVEIEGSAMRSMTVKQIADLWEIDAEKLLGKIVEEFSLQNTYSINSTLDDMRNENKFSPAAIKDIAENLKKEAAS